MTMTHTIFGYRRSPEMSEETAAELLHDLIHNCGLHCIHQEHGLCASCRAEYDEDPTAWLEYGEHEEGVQRWEEAEEAMREWQEAFRRQHEAAVKAGWTPPDDRDIPF
jgi:hypothetical protein